MRNLQKELVFCFMSPNWLESSYVSDSYKLQLKKVSSRIHFDLYKNSTACISGFISIHNDILSFVFSPSCVWPITENQTNY